jgi:hypothetical protein
MPSFAGLVALLQQQNNLQDVRLIIGSLLGVVFSPLCTIYNTLKKEREKNRMRACLRAKYLNSMVFECHDITIVYDYIFYINPPTHISR